MLDFLTAMIIYLWDLKSPCLASTAHEYIVSSLISYSWVVYLLLKHINSHNNIFFWKY